MSPLPDIHFDEYPPPEEAESANGDADPIHGKPGWTRHTASGTYVRKHPYLDGQHCDKEGHDLPDGSPPLPIPADPEIGESTPAYPFGSAEEFELADLLFKKIQMSASDINSLMDIWARFNDQNTPKLYDTIDSIPLGNILWQAFTVEYSGDIPDNAPSWMSQPYEVWFHDPLSVMEAQFGNSGLAKEIDFAPKQIKGKDGQRQYCDFMSGNWAWNQADEIARDHPDTHGSVFAPVILGSDKTTVSVATGQNEYYLLYASLGNVQNHVRRAHRDAVAVIGFLSIPKTHKQHAKSAAFRKFQRQLFHSSLRYILGALKPWMEEPKITRCSDGYFYRVIYGLGPYIADYPEQCLLVCIVSGWCAQCTAFPKDLDNDENACLRSYDHTAETYIAADGKLTKLLDGYGIIADILPFTDDFPRADIYELLAPDILHQIIKGTFKDHLVDWVIKYIYDTHDTKQEAQCILDEIDKRIDVVPPFPGLHNFNQGRDFKQWTGDDSKALMKVFLPAIVGLVPDQVVHTLAAFLEFCYLVQHSIINEKTLLQIDHTREIFIETGVRDTISLPRQHSVVHYRWLIQQFGAPNGLCSSITESKHIKAVKEPWQRSNHHNALGQMLLTNQRLDKLSAMRVHLQSQGFLGTPMVSIDPPDNNDENGWADDGVIGMEVDLNLCPYVSPHLTVNVFHSAVSLFYAPSNLSGIGGMCRQIIHVHIFLSFKYQNIEYPCALVHWFEAYHDSPCENTGLWRVEPHLDRNQHRLTSIIHVDSILRNAHLIPVYGHGFTPAHLTASDTLHSFTLYFVNKYADHHSHVVAF
ncbi:hypothetical protein BDQ17DRAFT_1388955 [Cyathus striatus]|nr:hypothetical protein BDQ17DRAFT_1388955 [Cyathus striatus]